MRDNAIADCKTDRTRHNSRSICSVTCSPVVQKAEVRRSLTLCKSAITVDVTFRHSSTAPSPPCPLKTLQTKQKNDCERRDEEIDEPRGAQPVHVLDVVHLDTAPRCSSYSRSILLNIVDQNLHTVFHRSAASRKRSSIRYHDEKQFCGDVDVRRYRFSTLIAAATHSPNGRCSMR